MSTRFPLVITPDLYATEQRKHEQFPEATCPRLDLNRIEQVVTAYSDFFKVR